MNPWEIRKFSAVVRERCNERSGIRQMQHCWLWRWRKVAVTQGTQVASKVWKSKERILLVFSGKEYNTANNLSQAQWDIEICPSEPQNNKIIFYDAKFGVLCYCDNLLWQQWKIILVLKSSFTWFAYGLGDSGR
jgi:hypothetical protein